MKKEKIEKKDKIEVDKEFLESVVKSNSDLRQQVEFVLKDIEELKKKKEMSIPSSSSPMVDDPKTKSIFWSAEIFIKPKSVQEQRELDFAINQFRKDLEVLMRKNNICSLTASIFYKNNESK